MEPKEKAIRLLLTLLFVVVVAIIFRFTLRPFLLTWGATDQEVEMVLPGDSYISNPSYLATRALTIDTRPREIYPWLVQMGRNKAGFYGYDWLNNGFRRSSDDILPEYQNIRIGDVVSMGLFMKMQVEDMVKDSFIVWKDLKNPTMGTWTWVLIPIGKRQTRLISRLRVDYNILSPAILLNMAVEVGDLPSMRKTMKGIKQRAEGDLHGNFSTDLAEALFLFIPFLALMLFFGRIFKKENWWEPLTMVGIMLVVFLFVIYVDLPLWALVLASFLVLLTLIGTAAESAAAKQHQKNQI